MSFVDATDAAYQVNDLSGASSALYLANLRTGATSLVLATQTAGILGWDLRADGSLTYLTASESGFEWHLKSNGSDRLLISWPFLSGRGADGFEWDSVMVRFSSDERYVGLVTTAVNGRGSQAPFQIRNMIGDLVDAYPQQDSSSYVRLDDLRTMAMWSRMGATLYYRDPHGVWRWDGPGVIQLVLPSILWVHPTTDVSGSWIAYAADGLGDRHRVFAWNVGSGATPILISGYGRTWPTFIDPGLVFYNGEQACNIECYFYPTDTGYVYALPGGPEQGSRLGAVIASWAG